MQEIHCYNCGGFIMQPETISFRLPSNAEHESRAATPNSMLCTCQPPVVYGTPSGSQFLAGVP